ncbi:T9SS type B sorting domain-containing protein [Spirosoma pollinicola]|uniref:T9SS type B sorting domain-containing protein n=1 Tax=Spirosoma pollinicola TaxID=2057025 RepID=UPI0014745568|nr:gliding motility-associated C-terminal domain-containing protein [Spirosoma pollinicola]
MTLATADPARRGKPIATASDSIVLLSHDSNCRGGDPILTVTGTQVRWYADANKKQLLFQGNTYQTPSLDQTTTYYLTQTLGGVETVPVAITIEIVELYLRNVVTTPASCGKNDGVISVTATGETARNPIYYSLNKGPAQRSPVFTNLAPGTYLLMDSSAAGCWGTSNVTVAAPPNPTISSVNTDDPSCGQSNGRVAITAFGGAGNFEYSLTGVDFNPANSFLSLAAGDYRVWVRDQDGCLASQPVRLKKSISLQLQDIDVKATHCGLSNGQIDLSRTLGNGQLTFSLDSVQVNTSGVFLNLAAKTYLVTVRDETGCRAAKSVIIDPSEGPAIGPIKLEPPACGSLDGRLTVSATAQGKRMYSVNGQDFQPDSSFSQLPAGRYEVTVKDGRNCLVHQIIQLGEPCASMVYMPDSFSPNGDGINDGWALFFPFTRLQLTDLIIYNRWGNVVFHRTNETLSNGAILWDGDNQEVVIGGFYSYQLRVQLPNGQSQDYQGKVAVLR